MGMDYYLILGIDSDASDSEIRDAYRRLVQKYHPDHFGEDASHFLRIQEAYKTLSDPVLRKKYDRRQIRTGPGKAARRGTGFREIEVEPLIPTRRSAPVEEIFPRRSFETFAPSAEEIFDRFLKNFGFGTKQKSETAGNMTVEIPISREQARRGGSMRILIPVQIRCPLCAGRGAFSLRECHYCGAQGTVDSEMPMIVSYPGGINSEYTKRVSLNRYGISNFYLTVRLTVSQAAG